MIRPGAKALHHAAAHHAPAQRAHHFPEQHAIRIDAAARRNLEDDQMIESRLGIAYEDECAVFGIDFDRRFTRDRDIAPSTSLLLTFRLKGIN